MTDQVLVKLVRGENGGKPWTWNVGEKQGLGRRYKITAKGTPVDKADAAILADPENVETFEGREFVIEGDYTPPTSDVGVADRVRKIVEDGLAAGQTPHSIGQRLIGLHGQVTEEVATIKAEEEAAGVAAAQERASARREGIAAEDAGTGGAAKGAPASAASGATGTAASKPNDEGQANTPADGETPATGGGQPSGDSAPGTAGASGTTGSRGSGGQSNRGR